MTFCILIFVVGPGESHGQRSLVGSSPRGRKESDATERPHFTEVILHVDGGYHIGQHWTSESKWVVDFKGTTLLSDPNQTTHLAYIFFLYVIHLRK